MSQDIIWVVLLNLALAMDFATGDPRVDRVFLHVCLSLSLAPQTPHGDTGHHQGGEGGLPSGHGEAGVALRREPLHRAPPLLHQRKDHHHPVPALTPDPHPL